MGPPDFDSYWAWDSGHDIPALILDTQTLEIQTPHGLESAYDNPLLSYTFNPAGDIPQWDKWHFKRTLRYPDSGSPDASSQPALLRR